MAQDGAPKRRLGRGLDALLGGKSQDAAEPVPVAIAQPVPAAVVSSQPVTFLAVDQIRRNPFQPRSEFDEDSLNDLAKSIGLHGVLQPVLVRKTKKGYQLIAGERRWLAAQRAGLKEVPCRVMDLADREVSEAAMEENLKRKDLNVLEKAQAFQDYVDRFACTIEELGKRLSMDRSTVSNMLRLLELPEPVRRLLHEEKITGGHAKAMLQSASESRPSRFRSARPSRQSERSSAAKRRTRFRSSRQRSRKPHRSARRTSTLWSSSFATPWA
jgi:ParB family chromosome partitioning protein